MDPHETKSTVRKSKQSIGKKWHLALWNKVFTNLPSDRGLISKLCKQFKKLNIKNPITQLKWYIDLNRIINRGIFNK